MWHCLLNNYLIYAANRQLYKIKFFPLDVFNCDSMQAHYYYYYYCYCCCCCYHYYIILIIIIVVVLIIITIISIIIVIIMIIIIIGATIIASKLDYCNSLVIGATDRNSVKLSSACSGLTRAYYYQSST